MTTTILVADDHPIFRDGLVKSLEEHGTFLVVGVAASATEAIKLAASLKPDIALLDLSMPGSGLSAIAQIASQNLAKHVAMLTVSEDGENVSEALRLGAKAYILKGVSARELRAILNDVAKGETHVTPSLAAKMLTFMTKELNAPSPLDDLTKREEDILRLVATGQSNREVADALGLQEKTVKHYMTTILEKLHARNRVEAALIAHKAFER
ncbi:response regulator transcription factor [Ruegeria sp. Alg231-54]|uniref:response regulator n=1 Tax=Ruegeria sp. Alg231-54 TaxID=1922221 RepID=UPI000D54D649|nr:response regulator transcription factor [Ruegeria sp. Alg231-54]